MPRYESLSIDAENPNSFGFTLASFNSRFSNIVSTVPHLFNRPKTTKTDEASKITPLPLREIACLGSIFFVEQLSLSVLFPFLVFMVEGFGYTGPTLGVHAGLLASSFSGAQFLSAYGWGHMSDRVGLKPCLIGSTIGGALCVVAFGFSRTYSQALCFRFLAGLLNGNLGLVKSFMGKITDDSNRSVGYSFIAVADGLGACVAPILGGVLASPAKSWPSVFEGTIFGANPFLLPCLLVGTTGVIVGISLVCVIEEPKAQLIDNRETKGDSSTVSLRIETTEKESDSAVLVQQSVVLDTSAVFSRQALVACISYGLVAGIQTMSDELIVLFLKLGRDRGGFGFSEMKIGQVYAVGGISTTLASALIGPPIERRIGAVEMSRWSLYLLTPIYSLFWCSGLILDHIPDWASFEILCIVMFLKSTALNTAFTGVIIAIVNSVPPEQLGSANGVGQTLASLARTVGPALCGALWSAGVIVGFIPLTFIVVGCICIACIAAVGSLPASLRYAYAPSKPNLDQQVTSF